MLTGLVVIGIVTALSVVAYRRGYAGYPAVPPGLAKLHRGEAAFVESVGEVLFPAGAGMAISGADAHLPHYIDRHLAALPRLKRFQIRLLFAVFEQITFLVPGDEPGGRARFSSLTAASRVSVLQRMAEHPNGLFRLLFTALRSIFVLGYLGHPANLHGLGLSPFEIEPAVSDAELLFPRIGGLMSSITYAASDRTDPAAMAPHDPRGKRHRAYARAGRNL